MTNATAYLVAINNHVEGRVLVDGVEVGRNYDGLGSIPIPPTEAEDQRKMWDDITFNFMEGFMKFQPQEAFIEVVMKRYKLIKR